MTQAPATPELVERLHQAGSRLGPLTRYGEDAVWRPATRARDALIDAAAALEAQQARIAELEAERRSVIANIPMDYLKAHDAAGATAPTASLDLVGAMRSYAEARWRIIDRCKEAEARAKTAIDQLKHWFGLAEKIEEEASSVVLAGLQEYLRVARSGGMPSSVAKSAGRVLEDYCRLYLGRDLVPVLRGISDARAEAAEANSARLEEALIWIALFAEMRGRDSDRTFAKVARAAVQTIAEHSRQALSSQGRHEGGER